VCDILRTFHCYRETDAVGFRQQNHLVRFRKNIIVVLLTSMLIKSNGNNVTYESLNLKLGTPTSITSLPVENPVFVFSLYLPTNIMYNYLTKENVKMNSF